MKKVLTTDLGIEITVNVGIKDKEGKEMTVSSANELGKILLTRELLKLLTSILSIFSVKLTTVSDLTIKQ